MVFKDHRVQKFRATSQTTDLSREGGEFSEIGTTGLRQFGGFVLEEWLQGLQGRRAAWAFREMMDNDPVVGAILFAIEQLARGVNWRVQEGDAERAEFVESNMHDMAHTWLDFISEALSMLPYGWSFHEEVLKRRRGKVDVPREFYGDWLRGQLGSTRFQDRERNNSLIVNETMENTAWVPASSEFKDGKIGWRKLPVRAQETLLRWWFDGYATVVAMEQIDWHGGAHVIPMDKALLFRTKTTRDNPEGRSILRNAWTSFYKLTNIQQIEAIGIERDLAGIPVLHPPEGVDLNAPGKEEVRDRAQELVTSIRKDEDEGVLMPTSGWVLDLLTTGGARQIDTSEVIRRYEQRIASSVLADFVLLGQDAIGSYAMVDIKSELFGTAIDTILDVICSVMNEQAIPRLLAANGMKTEDPPKITHSSAGRIDLEKVGRFFQSIALAGGPIPWSKELIEELFKEAGLPANFPGTALETAHHPTGDVTPVAGATPGLESRNGQRAKGPQNDGRERKLPSKTIAKAEEHSGAMVCLYPSPKVAQKLAVAGGEEPGALHVTMAFLGKAKDIKNPAALRAVVAGWAASCPPLEGEVSGVGRFQEGHTGDPVTYASIDVPHLSKKHDRLSSALSNAGIPPSGDHGFVPHMTLKYGKAKPGKIARPIKFKTVSLVMAGQREDFKLTGDPSAVAKADADEEEHSPAQALGVRAMLLSAQLQAEVQQALSELGEDAASAYMHEAQKATKPSKAQMNAIIRRVLTRMNTQGWVDRRLGPILANHAARVAMDTQRTLQQQTSLEMHLDDELTQALMASGGGQLKVRDIEPQVKAALMLAIEQGYEQGGNPTVVARRIRDAVPDGRFTQAGGKYRAELIARNETASLQRKATLGLYKSSPRVTAVRLRDGIYGPPRSDAECMARDGDEVPIDEAEDVQPYHPLCTLGFDPVIG